MTEIMIFGRHVPIGRTELAPGFEVIVGVIPRRALYAAFVTANIRTPDGGWTSVQSWAKKPQSAARSVEKKIRAFRDTLDAVIGGAA